MCECLGAGWVLLSLIWIRDVLFCFRPLPGLTRAGQRVKDVVAAVKWRCVQSLYSSDPLNAEQSKRNQKLLTLMKSPSPAAHPGTHTHPTTCVSVLKKCSSLWFRVSRSFGAPHDSPSASDAFVLVPEWHETLKPDVWLCGNRSAVRFLSVVCVVCVLNVGYEVVESDQDTRWPR